MGMHNNILTSIVSCYLKLSSWIFLGLSNKKFMKRKMNILAYFGILQYTTFPPSESLTDI